MAKIKKYFEYQGVQTFQFKAYPLGDALLSSHVYFVDGLLIDTGHSNVGKVVLESIKDLSINQICITHHHEDHTGNLNKLQRILDVPTYASKKCIEIMRKPPNLSLAQWLSWGRRPPNTKMKEIGKYIKTPNFTFEIIEAPGHAVDMICLYEPNMKWLFSADIYVHYKIRHFMRPESMKQQIESITKLLEFDFEVLFCSHNPQLKNGKSYLEKKLIFLKGFYQQVKDLYEKGYTPKSIYKTMNLKSDLRIRLLTQGSISTINMIKSVIRDEENV